MLPGVTIPLKFVSGYKWFYFSAMRFNEEKELELKSNLAFLEKQFEELARVAQIQDQITGIKTETTTRKDRQRLSVIVRERLEKEYGIVLDERTVQMIIGMFMRLVYRIFMAVKLPIIMALRFETNFSKNFDFVFYPDRRSMFLIKEMDQRQDTPLVEKWYWPLLHAESEFLKSPCKGSDVLELRRKGKNLKLFWRTESIRKYLNKRRPKCES